MANMIKNIIAFLFYLLLASPVVAQTASLLPQGRIQFFDNNGNPLAGGKVYNYIVGTTTFKTTWQDSSEATANTNPIILDSAGRATIYGQGAYRQIVRDANNNLIWDAVTSAIGSGGSSSATGDGDLVGTVKPWAGLTAPNQYAFAFGQELSRSTYSSLLTAITLTTNVTCTSASNTLGSISDTSSINIGAAIEATCVPAGTTVVSKTASAVVVSNPASLSVTVAARFFPFGNGNGTTTFNVPDLRGYVLAGRDNMGGVAASRLTTTYFGSNTPDALNATGGSQSTTLVQGNLPSVSLTTTIAAGQGAHTHTATTNAGLQSTQAGAGGATFMVSGTATVTVNSATLPQMTGTTPLGGSGTAISRIQPTVTMNYIIKVTPDTNSAIATGVTDIEGMTGSIGCGSGLLCTGNVISWDSSAIIPPLTIGNISYSSGTLFNQINTSLVTTPLVINNGPVVAPFGANVSAATLWIQQIPDDPSEQGAAIWCARYAGVDSGYIQTGCSVRAVSANGTPDAPTALAPGSLITEWPRADVAGSATPAEFAATNGIITVALFECHQGSIVANAQAGGPGTCQIRQGAGGSLTVTINNSSPAAATVTSNNHGLTADQRITLQTTGTLPSPLAIATTYCVQSGGSLTTNTFQLYNATGGACVGGTSIVTTTAGSGTHTLYAFTIATNVGWKWGEPLRGGTDHYITSRPGRSNTFPSLTVTGVNNVGLDLIMAGSGSLNVKSPDGGKIFQAVGATSGLLNYWTAIGGITGAAPTLRVGSDEGSTRAGNIQALGADSVFIGSSNGSIAAQFANGGSLERYFVFTPSATNPTLATTAGSMSLNTLLINGSGQVTAGTWNAGAVASSSTVSATTTYSLNGSTILSGGAPSANFHGLVNAGQSLSLGNGSDPRLIVTVGTGADGSSIAFNQTAYTNFNNSSGSENYVRIGPLGLGINTTFAANANLLYQTTAENLTNTRTINWVVNDADRTINLAGNLTTAAAFTTSGAFAATQTYTGVTNVTFPTTGTLATTAQVGLYQCGKLAAANFNTTSDQAITMSNPNTNYYLRYMVVKGASTSLTTAVGGIYTAAAKGGVAIVSASTTYSAITATTVNTANNSQLAASVSPSAWADVTTLYFSLTTPQGGAATADIYLYCLALP